MIFEYDKTDKYRDYYELLEVLIEDWENEIVEFKEARGNYSEDKIGQYFSAISNEANLKNCQYGWLIFGVSENKVKHPVGTNFKEGNASLLEKFKYEISKNITDGMTFIDVIEIHPVYNGKQCRVLMFKIPAATVGMPTAFKNKYYARSGDSLVSLQQYKIDQIRSQERRDWSKQVVDRATIDCLDKDAIKLARQKYKEKMNRPHISEETDAMTDEEFLTKIKLMRDGKVTNAAMVLLGSQDFDDLFEYAPSIMWRLYSSRNDILDYEIYNVPFISCIDRVFEKIRNLTYRYMPNQLSLFPMETQQYDTWLLRELLHNCIAHSNYQLGGRIYLNEFEDRIIITNPGDFLPEKITTVLQSTYNPPFYRNQLLADAMVKFHMIDTATSGIKKVFRIQKEKFFPMPDYNLTSSSQTEVTVYGKILDDKFMYILYNHPDLDIETVFQLDQIQKGNVKNISKEKIAYLRKKKLVEGRAQSLFLSAQISKTIEQEAQYVKNKAFNDQYYKDLIIKYLEEYQKAQKKDFRELLWDKLPDILDDDQKNHKLSNLLTSMKKNDIITTDSSNQQKSYWVLKK